MLKLTPRDQSVLEAVITDYIETGEPVGSRTISKRGAMNVSPATIRNVMADLEEMDLLHQPHTSAGRIPTVKGLRLYVDFIMQSRQLNRQDKEGIREALRYKPQDMKDLLHRTSLILSQYCRQTGVVLWPRLTVTRFKHLEFIRVGSSHIMVILISKGGLIHQTHIEWPEEITQAELDKYSGYVNELLQDVPITDVRDRILAEMRSEKGLFDQLFSRALEMAQRAIQSTMEGSDVYIEGRSNLFNNPEFADVERMRRILQTFEDKSRIIRLLDVTMKASTGIRIILGTESEIQEMQEMSLVSSPYGHGDTPTGVLGVIGPLRMDYSRIIPVVEFTAKLLSQVLEMTEES